MLREGKNKISAALVVFHEEDRIEKCLKSLKNFVDEIVVVHDGECSDNTLNICKNYGCKVFVRKHEGQAEPHRPFSLTKCSYEWVLFIDADERLSVGLQKFLKKATNSKYDAFYFKWVAKINGKKSNFMYKQILFRKDKMYYVGLPHMQPETRGIVTKSDYVLKHDTSEFDSSWYLLRGYYRKNKKWGLISAKMLIRPLNTIPVFNCEIEDNSLKQAKKIRFIKKAPYVAIIVVPVYSFLYAYLKNKNYKQGFLGFVLSCHVPLHSFFTSYFLCLYKIGLLKK